MEVFRGTGLGSRQRSVRRAPLHLWHPGFVASVADHRHPIGRGSRGIHDRNVPEVVAWAALVHDRTAGGDSERDLWVVGDLRTRPNLAQLCAAIPGENFGVDGLVLWPPVRHWNVGGRN